MNNAHEDQGNLWLGQPVAGGENPTRSQHTARERETAQREEEGVRGEIGTYFAVRGEIGTYFRETSSDLKQVPISSLPAVPDRNLSISKFRSRAYPRSHSCN